MSETMATYNEGNGEKNITAEANEARLLTLATEINAIKRTTQRMMMQAAIDIGKRLVEVKAAVGHGNWGKWLLENVDYSERTAQNLIRLFEEYGMGQGSLFGEGGNPQLVADLSVSQAVALLGIKDADERAEFIEGNDVAAMTKRELEEAIRERNEAREALSAEKEAWREAKAEAEKAKGRLKTLKETFEKADKKKDNELLLRAKEAAVQKTEVERLEAELKAARALAAEKEASGGGSAEDKARIEELTAALKKAEDTSRWEFAAGVKGLQEGFNGLLRLLERQEAEDQARYREALRTLLSKMAELVS